MNDGDTEMLLWGPTHLQEELRNWNGSRRWIRACPPSLLLCLVGLPTDLPIFHQEAEKRRDTRRKPGSRTAEQSN